MEKVFDFLSKHKDVAFATVEQNKPKIRVFQIMKQEGHTLCHGWEHICTGDRACHV